MFLAHYTPTAPHTHVQTNILSTSHLGAGQHVTVETGSLTGHLVLWILIPSHGQEMAAIGHPQVALSLSIFSLLPPLHLALSLGPWQRHSNCAAPHQPWRTKESGTSGFSLTHNGAHQYGPVRTWCPRGDMNQPAFYTDLCPLSLQGGQ